MFQKDDLQDRTTPFDYDLLDVKRGGQHLQYIAFGTNCCHCTREDEKALV